MNTGAAIQTSESDGPNAAARTIDAAAGALLEYLMAQIGADGVYLYYTAAGLEIGCFAGLAPAWNGGNLSAIAAKLPLKSSDIIILGRPASGNPGREFPPDPFQSGAVTAVTAGGQRQGILMLGRFRGSSFVPGELALLETFREPLGGLIAGAAAAEENEQLRAESQRLKEKLAARTIVERAKGIIQARDGCTEAEAYSHLRRLSRSTREPMYEIARRLLNRPEFPSRGRIGEGHTLRRAG